MLSIKEDEEAIKKEQESAEENQEETSEEQEEEEDIESQEEDTEDESASDDEEEKEAEEEKEPTNADFARMRREKAAAEKRAAELEERLAAKDTDEGEEENPDAALIQDVIQDRKRQAARDHLATFEDDFRKQVKDYDQIAGAYAQQIARSIYVNNPRLSEREIVKRTEDTLLERAADYYNKGMNPVEEIYNDALNLGIKPQEEKEEKKEEARKPDLDTVAKNKKRSAGMAGTKGKGTGPVETKEALADMPLSEFAKIPAHELERIERGT